MWSTSDSNTLSAQSHGRSVLGRALLACVHNFPFCNVSLVGNAAIHRAASSRAIASINARDSFFVI